MILLRVISAEALKLKRTLAWRMAMLAPGLVVLLAFLATWQAPFSSVGRHGKEHEWEELIRFCLRLWAILMLPLYIVLQTALLAGLDHASGQWRNLMARPVPRWNFYAVKLLFILALTASASGLLALGVALDGIILPHLQHQVSFTPPVPWQLILIGCIQVFGLSFVGLVVQNWISLRWHSFSAAVAAGIVLIVLGVSASAVGQATDSLIRFFPSALPMLILGRESANVGTGLIVSLAGCVLGLIAAGLDFCRREVN